MDEVLLGVAGREDSGLLAVDGPKCLFIRDCCF